MIVRRPPSLIRKQGLSPKQHQNLVDSGLTVDTIVTADIRGTRDAAEAQQLLRWNGLGPVPATVYPNLGLDGCVNQCYLKPDNPRMKNGKPVKYESPVGSPYRPYFPPEQLVPRKYYSDTSVPLLFVEGIKKALAAAQTGEPIGALSSQGTTVWHDKDYKDKTGNWRLHSDILELPIKDRTVFIAFDGGDTSINLHVIAAEARLVKMVRAAGGDARLIRIPAPSDGRKVGLDDYLAEVPS